MKIIKEKSTNIVIFAERNLSLTSAGVQGDNFRASNIKPEFYELVTTDSIPSDYQGHHYTYTDSTWTRTPAGLASAKIAKLAELAALRYEKETAGITIPGSVIRTDRQSQALLTGAWTAAQMNPDISIDWKGENGWTTLNKAQITAIAGAVITHVQACFTREKVLAALITTDVNTDITTGWPE